MEIANSPHVGPPGRHLGYPRWPICQPAGTLAAPGSSKLALTSRFWPAATEGGAATAGAAVCVGVDVSVGVAVGLGVVVGVCVAVAVAVGAGVAVAVCVGFGVPVGTSVGSGVAVGSAVGCAQQPPSSSAVITNASMCLVGARFFIFAFLLLARPRSLAISRRQQTPASTRG